jgi:CubicO group peptidase (beta-lactamase class C family)
MPYLRLICSLILLPLLLSISLAQSPNVNDPKDLEAFLDGVLYQQLASKHVAGAVVTIVSGDKMIFSKGYGYSDVANRKPVDPDKTLFRIGSVSKLFTWTVVMQEIEAGRLDMDADINKYLGSVQIPSRFGKPITMRHLLTHTPGFEDYVLGLFSRGPENRSLSELLISQMPERIRPPGELAAYSNYGTALAGHVVANLAKKPWEDLIDERLLKPLGMQHTLARQPAKDQLPANMSKGYHWAGGQWQEKDFEYVPWAPAGAFSASGSDMAKFMIAHLNDGAYGEVRILKPETAQKMRQPLFSNHPKVSPMASGFILEQHHGLTLVGHGGDTMWFHSMLQLFPEKKLGLFVSYNTDSVDGAREALLKAFLDRYFPQAFTARAKSPAGMRDRAKKYVGEYQTLRYSDTTIGKLVRPMSATEVSLDKDDVLIINRGDKSFRFIEVEPGFYREQDGQRTVAFKEAENGEIALAWDNAAPMAAVKVAWHQSKLFHLSIVVACVGLMLTALLFWPAIAFTIRGYSHPTVRRSGFSAVLSVIAWLMCLSCVILFATLATHLVTSDEVVFGLPPEVQLLMKLTFICAGLVVITLLGCLLAWIMGYWRFSGRLHYTLVALAGVGFIWFHYYWNIIPKSL